MPRRKKPSKLKKKKTMKRNSRKRQNKGSKKNKTMIGSGNFSEPNDNLTNDSRQPKKFRKVRGNMANNPPLSFNDRVDQIAAPPAWGSADWLAEKWGIYRHDRSQARLQAEEELEERRLGSQNRKNYTRSNAGRGLLRNPIINTRSARQVEAWRQQQAFEGEVLKHLRTICPAGRYNCGNIASHVDFRLGTFRFKKYIYVQTDSGRKEIYKFSPVWFQADTYKQDPKLLKTTLLEFIGF